MESETRVPLISNSIYRQGTLALRLREGEGPGNVNISSKVTPFLLALEKSVTSSLPEELVAGQKLRPGSQIACRRILSNEGHLVFLKL